jgi:hypothetical protein
MKTALIAFIFFVSLTQTAVLADGNTGMIRGVVRDITGKPIAGASVYWTNPAGLGNTTTDRFGRFELFGVLVGDTTVYSVASGYTPNCRYGWVSANQDVNLVVQLPTQSWIDVHCTPFPFAGIVGFYQIFRAAI